MTKTCRSCGKDQPASEFTRVKQNRDGLCSYCKACVRARSRKHYYEQGGRERAAEKSPGRWQRVKARYGPVYLAYSRSERGKEVSRKKRRKWTASGKARAWRAGWVMSHRPMIRAHEAVRRALRAGKLVRPPICSQCGKSEQRIEAHHHQGYDRERWLDVVWLCVKCHRKADREKRAA